jgi:uncharacterized protein YvpB
MLLKVPYIKQFNTHSCYVASAAMVMAFYGNKINQKLVYQKAKITYPNNKKEVWGCLDADLMLAINNKDYRMDLWVNYKPQIKQNEAWSSLFKKYRIRLDRAKKLGMIMQHKNADTNLIKRFIKKGIPVIIEVHSNTWFGLKKFSDSDTHNIVVVGCKSNTFIINDPFLPYLKMNGKNFEVSAKRLKAAWEAPPYFKNSMTVLTVKEQAQAHLPPKTKT